MSSHGFLRLPTELRWSIWSHFCPELAFQPLLLKFDINEDNGNIRNGPTLESVTATVRTVLAVHQDSRLFALKVLPDTLSFGGGYDLVRFHKERDVVVIVADFDLPPKRDSGLRLVPGFSEFVVNLMMQAEGKLLEIKWLQFYCCFPNLKVLFQEKFLRDKPGDEDPSWYQSNLVHHYTDESYIVHCWPNLTHHRDYARRHIQSEEFPVGIGVAEWALWNVEDSAQTVICPCVLTEHELDHLAGIKLWPMITYAD